MKAKPISLRRRQLLIAAVVTAVVPAGAFAAISALTREGAPGSSGDGDMVVSGRMLRPDGKPLSGATVAAWHASSQQDYIADTDADGRFMLKMAGRSAHINYRVTHPDHTTLTSRLHFIPTPGVADNHVSQLRRDEAGDWRTTFGVTLA